MVSEYSPLFTPRIIGIFVLIMAGAIAFGIALIVSFRVVSRWMTGWKALAQRFPVTDVHKFGEKYGATGTFAHIRGTIKGFIIELAQEGLLVTANFAKRSPILISWSDIHDVEETDLFGRWSFVRITVDYEKELSFNIPKEALTAIQGNIPAERFRKAASLLEVLSNRGQEKPDTSKLAVNDQSWEDNESAKVDSWWGAVAALMLLQAYSFILLQGLIYVLTRMIVVVPILIPWFLIIALSQAGGLRVMNKYLKTHDWKTALRFLHSPVETLKFCAAILAMGIYVYFLTGHKPVPADPALYRDVGIFGSLMFQLFYLALSFLLNWLWKVTPKIEAARLAVSGDAKVPSAGWMNVVGGTVAMVIGISLIVVCCYDKEAFYSAGVFGYGVIVIVLSPVLTTDLRSWVVKN